MGDTRDLGEILEEGVGGGSERYQTFASFRFASEMESEQGCGPVFALTWIDEFAKFP